MGARRVAIPESVLDEARKMLAYGTPWKGVAAQLGVSSETLRRRLDPAYDLFMREKYERRSYGRVDTAHRPPRPMTDAALKAYKALIPPDTRSLTARLLGDPIPGDMRRAG